MFAACPVPSVSALVAPRRPKTRSRYPFGNSCNDIPRQKSVLRRPSSVLCRISNHPRSSSDPPPFSKPEYVGPVGTTKEYMTGTDNASDEPDPAEQARGMVPRRQCSNGASGWCALCGPRRSRIEYGQCQLLGEPHCRHFSTLPGGQLSALGS